MTNQIETPTQTETPTAVRTRRPTLRRPNLRRAVLASAVVLLAALIVVGYVLSMAFLTKPANGPDAFRDRAAGTPLTVVAGASVVQGRISADWVSGLQTPGGETVNAGLNGHTTTDMLGRLDRDVIELDPERVILLVGTNDIRGNVDPSVSRANMVQILDKLTTQTEANVAVMSLPPLGEQPDSEQNQKILAYNAMVAEEAAKRDVDYLPLNENLVPLLGSDAPDFSFPILQTAFDRFLFGKTFNQMSDSHGLRVTVDNVHLNERGAAVAGRLAAEWLEKN